MADWEALSLLMERPGFILVAGKIPDWRSMPRAYSMKREAGHGLSWSDYQSAGALATLEEAVRHTRTGTGKVGIVPSFAALAVLDADRGPWRDVANDHPPLAVTRTPGLDSSGRPKNAPYGCAHLWYREPIRSPRGYWSHLNVSGETRWDTGYVVLHEGPDPVVEAICECMANPKLGRFPAFALPKVQTLSPPPQAWKQRTRIGQGEARAKYLEAVLDGRVKALRTATPGQATTGRHDTLRASARLLAGLYQGAGRPAAFDARAAKNALHQAFMLAVGGVASRSAEGVKTIKYGWRDGEQSPIQPPAGWRD